VRALTEDDVRAARRAQSTWTVMCAHGEDFYARPHEAIDIAKCLEGVMGYDGQPFRWSTQRPPATQLDLHRMHELYGPLGYTLRMCTLSASALSAGLASVAGATFPDLVPVHAPAATIPTTESTDDVAWRAAWGTPPPDEFMARLTAPGVSSSLSRLATNGNLPPPRHGTTAGAPAGTAELGGVDAGRDR
jgi:hypothetical protein